MLVVFRTPFPSRLALTFSITVTLAPKSARTMPQWGTGARPASSITRTPCNSVRFILTENKGSANRMRRYSEVTSISTNILQQAQLALMRANCPSNSSMYHCFSQLLLFTRREQKRNQWTFCQPNMKPQGAHGFFHRLNCCSLREVIK